MPQGITCADAVGEAPMSKKTSNLQRYVFRFESACPIGVLSACCDYMLAGESIITVRLACSLCESTSLVRRNHPAAARHPSTGGELKRALTPFPSFGELPSVGGGVVQSPQPHSLKYFESSFVRIYFKSSTIIAFL